MNNKFDERTKRMAQSVTRRAALKKLEFGLTALLLATSLAWPAAGAGPASTISLTDPAGDAVFPFDLYGGALVPPYLDVIEASVSLTRGVFHFEIKMSAEIPANADPGFTPGVNHLGGTFGILTDPKTAGAGHKFPGQTDKYEFNFLVGAVYSVQDSGVGLPSGWSAFLAGPNGFSEIALVIRGDTLIFETAAASLGYPSSFAWVVGCECDPALITEEHHRSVIMVDYIPQHGYANWPSMQR